jgi:hypothetical protein
MHYIVTSSEVFHYVCTMGRIRLLAVSQAFLALGALSSPVASASSPIIDLGYAQYQGSVDTATNITSFLGIRYAAPPVGGFSFYMWYTILAHASTT